ncbi:MAG: hypothetical protein RIR79_408 [Pseudomonadota bacterium]|jgi:tetratricopeptide (TPR) repeat protein
MQVHGNTIRTLFITVGFAFALQPIGALAGWKEGTEAYKKGDFAVAVKEFKPLAQKGNSKAQYKLGVLYTTGQGVRQDYQEAIKWFRLAVEQKDAGGENNLGAMYESGYGVKVNRVAAYALYNLSHDSDSAKDNPAYSNRTKITKLMSKKEIEIGQTLTREMLKPHNRLKALDQYLKQHEQESKSTKAEKTEKTVKTGK